MWMCGEEAPTGPRPLVELATSCAVWWWGDHPPEKRPKESSMTRIWPPRPNITHPISCSGI
jgi:hypothetical protein